MQYPKIHNLYKRDEKTKKLIEGEYSQPEFEAVKTWHVTEKIDGTNIRVSWKAGRVTFSGRTDSASLPANLFEYLQSKFTSELLASVFSVNASGMDKPQSITLYGEGYGPKIQAVGSNYRNDVGFILFDVWANGWWLKREDVSNIAEKLDIPSVPQITFRKYIESDNYKHISVIDGVTIKDMLDIDHFKPVDGIQTIDEMVKYVRSKPMSYCSLIPQMMEGVICRSNPLMLFRNGDPIMFKLKCRDFV